MQHDIFDAGISPLQRASSNSIRVFEQFYLSPFNFLVDPLWSIQISSRLCSAQQVLYLLSH